MWASVSELPASLPARVQSELPASYRRCWIKISCSFYNQQHPVTLNNRAMDWFTLDFSFKATDPDKHSGPHGVVDSIRWRYCRMLDFIFLSLFQHPSKCLEIISVRHRVSCVASFLEVMPALLTVSPDSQCSPLVQPLRGSMTSSALVMRSCAVPPWRAFPKTIC